MLIVPIPIPRLPAQGAKIYFKHTKECDRFYDIGQGDKVRVTTDQVSKKIVGIVQKVRVANLNVFSPGAPFDYRISINVEMPGKLV